MKRPLVLLLAALLVFAAAGCMATTAPASTPTAAAATSAAVAATTAPDASPAASQAGPGGAPQASVTDFLGNTVTLTNPPERIISLSPANTEIIYALGLQTKLVGVDASSDYPDAAKAIAKVGDFSGPNLETIVSLKPDLVLGGNKLQKATIDKIKELGINVVAAEATTYEDVTKSIDLIAGLTGTQFQAQQVEADMKAKEKIVLDAVAKATTGKTVYYAMSFGDNGNWTAGPGSFQYELIKMAGGKTITDTFPVAWVNMSQEQLVKSNPDIILLDSLGCDKATFLKTAPYKDLKAVKDGQVFVVTSNFCTRPGPRIVYGLREFAEAVTGTTIKFPGE